MTEVLPASHPDESMPFDRSARGDEIAFGVDARAGADVTAAIPAQFTPVHIAPASKLSEREQRMLAFERKWWRRAGSKEQAIREQFDLSATRYYQLLNRLLELPEALEFDPVVVSRLRRLRATRTRAAG